jgi:hypothetical protein
MSRSEGIPALDNEPYMSPQTEDERGDRAIGGRRLSFNKQAIRRGVHGLAGGQRSWVSGHGANGACNLTVECPAAAR